MVSLKEQAAIAALSYIQDNSIVGVGTGSTVNFLITHLAAIKSKIDACVASSIETEKRLKTLGLPVIDLNAATELTIYIDGADEVNSNRQMIKGGGGALTREKILATVANYFICIVDESKKVERLGEFPIAVEVLPIARSLVGRELVKLGGDPVYRENYLTDNGNIILDLYNLNRNDLCSLEEEINLIPGVVENGLFVKRVADKVLMATDNGVEVL